MLKGLCLLLLNLIGFILNCFTRYCIDHFMEITGKTNAGKLVVWLWFNVLWWVVLKNLGFISCQISLRWCFWFCNPRKMGCRAATSNNTVLAISLNGYVNGVMFKQYCTEHCININGKTKQVREIIFLWRSDFICIGLWLIEKIW